MEELQVLIKCDYQEFINRKDLKNVSIARGRERIGVMAFENCKELESVIIPSGIKTIMTYAFKNCISLTKITIPKSVSTIGVKVFNQCEKLENIDFLGTMDDWKAIDKRSDFAEGSALKTITCTDGVVAFGEVM